LRDNVVDASFGPGDRDKTAPANVLRFRHAVSPGTDELSILRPVIESTGFDFARSLSLSTHRPDGVAIEYNCAFGVPTRADDVPTGAIAYSRVGFDGTALYATGGRYRRYVVQLTDGTVTYDSAARRVITSLHLRMATIDDPSIVIADLGTFSGSAPIEAAQPSFAGTLTKVGNPQITANLGGWFFGPQGGEVAFSVSIRDPDFNSGGFLSLAGTGFAAR
jgi:hypothetical protein